VADQLTCDRCGAELRSGAAYCDKCGERTRRARRTVRLAVRVEVLLIALSLALVFGFAAVYYFQR
jgi:ribosomal protein L40E